MTEPRNRCYLVARIDREVVGYGGPDLLRRRGARHQHRRRPRRSSGARSARACCYELIRRCAATWAPTPCRSRSASRTGGRSGCTGGSGSARSAFARNYYQEIERGRADHVDRRRPDPEYAAPSWPRSPARLPRACAARVRVLGIETSCDETAVAVVEDGFDVRSNLIASQIDLHERFGGVVPELASRAHVEALNPLIDEALEEAGLPGSATSTASRSPSGPGLVGALLVGIAAAKAVALATGVPLIGVNHLEGHIYANFLDARPAGAAVRRALVSGGHTMLVHMPEEHPLRGARPDARRRRRRGVRQDRAVPRPRVPGRAGARPAGARRQTRRRSRFPRAMADPATTTSRCRV